MEDPIRLSDLEFSRTFAAGFMTWAGLHSQAMKSDTLPVYSFFSQDSFQLHPSFPQDLDMAIESGFAIASGHAIWTSTPATCGCSFPSFRQSLRLDMALEKPILLSMSDAQPERYPSSWFTSQHDYLAVLTLAWAYILSARLAELAPRFCSLAYTNSVALHDASAKIAQDTFLVDIGDVCPQEGRWWAAVLAQNQGWQASLEPSFCSPWSIRLESETMFTLSSDHTALPTSPAAASFSDACSYLNNFCLRHNMADQSHAALAAVLLFPYLGDSRTLHVPTPKLRQRKPIRISSHKDCSHLDWIHGGQHIDRLLTLSCNLRGIPSLLLSVFYEPSIACNAATPWIQGSLAAIKSLGRDDPSIVSRMCMQRTPELACLWLGISVLGLQEELLSHVRSGGIPVDLPSAAWSKTIQAFIQQPISSPLEVDGCVQRADECRLLFLSQSRRHTRAPVCQWKPFGETPTKDVDLEVRAHMQCRGHALQYEAFVWNSAEGESDPQVPEGDTHVLARPDKISPECACDIAEAEAKYREDDDVISENATRNIFSWLRPDGCAEHEQSIYKHDWLNSTDSDEEEELLVEVTPSGKSSLSRIWEWIELSKPSRFGC
jgi:hypothetical protein